jgi:hypothetical protein
MSSYRPDALGLHVRMKLTRRFPGSKDLNVD